MKKIYLLLIIVAITLSTNSQSLLFEIGLTSYNLNPTAKIGYSQNIDEDEMDLFHFNFEGNVLMIPATSNSKTGIGANMGLGLQYWFDEHAIYRMKLLITNTMRYTPNICINEIDKTEYTKWNDKWSPGFILTYEANRGYVSLNNTTNMFLLSVGFRFFK